MLLLLYFPRLAAAVLSQMGRPFKRAENAARASAKIVAHAAAAVAEAEADIRRKHRPLKVPENERAANEKRAEALAVSQAKLRQVKRNALYMGLMLMRMLLLYSCCLLLTCVLAF